VWNEFIPYVTGPKKHVVSMQPYPGITLAMPGRHQNDTPIPGADFVVMVTDAILGWNKHQFTHTDIFKDLERRDKDTGHHLMSDYLKIVQGADPREAIAWPTPAGCISTLTFMCAVQALAVAEHRRYAKYEPRWGGKYLPFRFGAGIVEGLWSAADAIDKQRRGRPGVEWLEKDHGMPTLTKELINA
jgi:hypothetical protein